MELEEQPRLLKQRGLLRFTGAVLLVLLAGAAVVTVSPSSHDTLDDLVLANSLLLADRPSLKTCQTFSSGECIHAYDLHTRRSR